MEYTAEDTIFVQIASYRDPELQHTLQDLFAKAKRPENIFVGICLTYDMIGHEDDDLFTNEFPRTKQLRIIKVDYRNSKSISFSKNKAQQLYKNEKWVLQIDAHMRFKENWDKILVLNAKKTDNGNCVFSCYMPGYSINPYNTNFDTINGRTRIFISNQTYRNSYSNINLKDNIEISSACFGPFLFSNGKIYNSLKWNEEYGSFDEFQLCAKVFTYGYNMYTIKEVVVNHLFSSEISSGMKKARIPYQNSINSLEIFHCQFNIKKSNNRDVLNNITKYPLGEKRTLRDYERFAGVNFRKLSIKDHARLGIFEKWVEVSKIKEINKIFSNKYKYNEKN